MTAVVAPQEPNAIQDGATRLEAAAEQTHPGRARCTREEAERRERAAELAAILKAKDDLAATQREEADRLIKIERQRLNDEAAVERASARARQGRRVGRRGRKESFCSRSQQASESRRRNPAQAQKCGPRLLVG